MSKPGAAHVFLMEKDFCERIRAAGGEAYIVGGWVRDTIMGRAPNDKDYAVCRIGENDFCSMFPSARRVGGSFPVFLIEIDGRVCETAFVRTERKSGRGYKGFDATTSKDITIEQDLFRRDVTINAMALSLPGGVLIDPFGGRADIEKRVIRAVSERFIDDPVRALRAAVYASVLDFSITTETLAMMRTCRAELEREPGERKVKEVLKAIAGQKPAKFFLALYETGLLGTLLPETLIPYGNAKFQEALSCLDSTSQKSKSPVVRFTAFLYSLFTAITNASCPGDVLEELRVKLPLPKKYVILTEFIIRQMEFGYKHGINAALAVRKIRSAGIEDETCALGEILAGASPFMKNCKMYIEAMSTAKLNCPEGLKGSEIGAWRIMQEAAVCDKVTKELKEAAQRK